VASCRVVLHFPRNLIDQPVICRLVQEYGLEFNILRADITPHQEGLMVLELSGPEENLQQGLEYARTLGLKIQPLSQDVVRDEEKCTHCGACVTICPVGALSMDPETYEVKFEHEKCIACALCVPACPPRAMLVKF